MSRDNQTCSAAGHKVRSRAGSPFGASVCDSTNRSPGPGGEEHQPKPSGKKTNQESKKSSLTGGRARISKFTCVR